MTSGNTKPSTNMARDARGQMIEALAARREAH
jgi:hypothetical protein